MPETLMKTLRKLLLLTGMQDLFDIVVINSETKEEYRSQCERWYREEGLVVDNLAYYKSSARAIVFCSNRYEETIRAYGIDSHECLDAFTMYVLLHEFTHYITDILGYLEQISTLSKAARFDEPFCEYVALRSLATGVYRVFGYERRFNSLSEMRKCLPFIASLHRPYPYSLFKELFAIPSEIFSVSVEDIFISLHSAVMQLRNSSRGMIEPVNPDSMLLARLLLLKPLSARTHYAQVDYRLTSATSVKVLIV